MRSRVSPWNADDTGDTHKVHVPLFFALSACGLLERGHTSATASAMPSSTRVGRKG